MLSNIVFWIQLITAIMIVVLVVLQPSKGSDLGSMAGGSNSTNNKAYVDPLTKVTGVILLTFVISSFFVTYLDNEKQNTSIITNSSEIIEEKTNDK